MLTSNEQKILAELEERPTGAMAQEYLERLRSMNRKWMWYSNKDLIKKAIDTLYGKVN